MKILHILDNVLKNRDELQKTLIDNISKKVLQLRNMSHSALKNLLERFDRILIPREEGDMKFLQIIEDTIKKIDEIGQGFREVIAEKALQLRNMPHSELEKLLERPNWITRNAVIIAFALNGNMREARRLLEEHGMPDFLERLASHNKVGEAVRDLLKDWNRPEATLMNPPAAKPSLCVRRRCRPLLFKTASLTGLPRAGRKNGRRFNEVRPWRQHLHPHSWRNAGLRAGRGGSPPPAWPASDWPSVRPSARPAPLSGRPVPCPDRRQAGRSPGP